MMPPKAIVMQRPARKCDAVLHANGRVLAFRCRSQASFQEKLHQFVCKQTTKGADACPRQMVGDLATGSCAQQEKSAAGFADRALSQVYDGGNCRRF
jgi:hypothetical protein